LEKIFSETGVEIDELRDQAAVDLVEVEYEDLPAHRPAHRLRHQTDQKGR
jgi:hypothetical protein